MAPSGSSKKSGRRLRATRQFNLCDGTKVESEKVRVEHDVIEGIDVYSFNDELELEYFSNIEEPLPRKIKRFQGFDDTYTPLDLIKNHFEAFVKRFLSTGNIGHTSSDNPLISRAIQLREDSLENIGNSHVHDDGKDSTVLVSEDENSLSAAAPKFVTTKSNASPGSLNKTVSDVVTTGPFDGSPVKIVDEPVEVITINDSDSDDDVIMISDPKVPLPKPVRNCCPNCGKVRRAKPRQNGETPSGSGEGTGQDSAPVLIDEVLIIADEDMPIPAEEASVPPKDTSIQTSPKTPIQIESEPTQKFSEILAPVQHQDTPAEPENVLTLPEDDQHDEVPSQPTEPQTDAPDRSISESEGDILTGEVSSTTDDMLMITDDNVSAQLHTAPIHPEELFVQPEDKTPQLKELSVQLVEPSAPQVRKRAASSSEDEPSLKAQGVYSSTDELGSLPSCSSRIASGGQKPTRHQIESRPSVPGSVRVVLPETGKTVILKLDGAKSKMLPPSSKKPLVRTYHVPQQELPRAGVPGSHVSHKAIGAQPTNEAIRRVLIPNYCIAKLGVVAPGSPLPKGLNALNKSQVKQQAVKSHDSPSKIFLVKSLEESHLVSDLCKDKLGISREIDGSAVIESQTPHVPAVSAK